MRWKKEKREKLMDRCIAELREDKELPKDRWMDYLIGAHGQALVKWDLKPEEVVAKLEKQDAAKIKMTKFDLQKI
jgi:hypothetical protein